MKQEIACPLCGKKSYQLYLHKPHRRIVRCQRDGLVFVNPQPTKGEINTLYNQNYFASDQKRTDSSLGYYDYLSERPLLLPYFRRKIVLLKRLLRGRKVLEIGSSYGFFVEEAKRAHLDILGIDISKEPIAWARRRGLPVRAVDLFGAKFQTNSFDGVVAFHLIEHVLDPLTFMREVYRVTRPGGVVLLATPKEGGYVQKIMGKGWFSYRHQEHLFFFSKRTMTMLLAKAGFSNIRCFGDETRWYPIRFLLRGATYYIHNPWWLRAIKLFNLNVSIPMPLDTMMVTAEK